METLQIPKEEGFLLLEKDFKDFSAINLDKLTVGINVSISQLDDGSGIKVILESHGVKYHKICKTYGSSSSLKCATESLAKESTTQQNCIRLRLPGEFQPHISITSCVMVCLSMGTGAKQIEINN